MKFVFFTLVCLLALAFARPVEKDIDSSEESELYRNDDDSSEEVIFRSLKRMKKHVENIPDESQLGTINEVDQVPSKDYDSSEEVELLRGDWQRKEFDGYFFTFKNENGLSSAQSEDNLEPIQGSMIEIDQVRSEDNDSSEEV